MKSEMNAQLVNALPNPALRKGLQLSSLDVNPDWDREQILGFLDSSDRAKDLREDIKTGAKRHYLSKGVVKPTKAEISGPETGIPPLASRMSLLEACYYHSYFRFADHSTHLFHIHNLGGVLEEISKSDDVPNSADLLESHLEVNNLEEFQQATGNLPAPLIGAVAGSFKPRLVRFESPNILYVEYWKQGGGKSGLDVRTGEYTTIKEPHKVILRIDTDRKTVETAGKNTSNTYNSVVKSFLTKFNGADNQISPIQINSTDIEQVRSNLALVATLDEFVGDDTKLRITLSQGTGNVEIDPVHEDASQDRDLGRSNFAMIVGKSQSGWEPVYPPRIADEFELRNEVAVGDILTNLEEKQGYSDARNVTISLSMEKNSFRIQKKKLSPKERHAIYEIIANELSW